MAHAVKDSFLDLERHRQLLEDSIEKLRKSLRHWQIWEAEYEGLKEDILVVDPTPTDDQLQEIGRNYQGELVNQREIDEILGGATKRTAAHIVNLLDRRIDYVNQNVRTIQKQIEIAENKLAAATIISTPDVRNEEGLPLTDIVEELDEEGNIISSHTTTPGSAKPQLLEVLKKAGVKDIPAGVKDIPARVKDIPAGVKDIPAGVKDIPAGVKDIPAGVKDIPAGAMAELREPLISEEEAFQASLEKQPKATKKGVKFAADTKQGPEFQKSQTAKRSEEIMNLTKEQDVRPTEPPIIPTDESAQDAALRQQMLQYGLSEVGAVVAELDLEQGSDWSGDEYDDETSDEDEDEDDEDKYGRSTGRIVNDELRQQMIELEKRLGARVMENIGKKASDFDLVREGIGQIKVNKTTQDASSEAQTSRSPTPSSMHQASDENTSKKSVRFSEDLDISPAPQKSIMPRAAKITPVGNVVERTSVAQTASPSSTKKLSRFKKDRSVSTTNTVEPFTNVRPGDSFEGDQTRYVPTGPEGKILAPSVIERDVPLDILATEPDELDPQLIHQEVATEYHKARNRMIQRQGGFMQEEESEIVPFTEEEGGPKKMSRFKAARLAKR